MEAATLFLAQTETLIQQLVTRHSAQTTILVQLGGRQLTASQHMALMRAGTFGQSITKKSDASKTRAAVKRSPPFL